MRQDHSIDTWPSRNFHSLIHKRYSIGMSRDLASTDCSMLTESYRINFQDNNLHS